MTVIQSPEQIYNCLILNNDFTAYYCGLSSEVYTSKCFSLFLSFVFLLWLYFLKPTQFHFKLRVKCTGHTLKLYFCIRQT